MLRRLFSLALSWLFLTAGFAAADPVGSYAVRGVGPSGSGEYAGTVAVTRTDEKYQVVWSVGGKTTRGVALGGAFYQGAFVIGPAHPDDLMLAIGYTDGTIYGTATMFLQQDGTYEGFRLYSNGSKSGQEVWTPVE